MMNEEPQRTVFTWSEMHTIMVAVHDYYDRYGDVSQETRLLLERLIDIEGTMRPEQVVEPKVKQ